MTHPVLDPTSLVDTGFAVAATAHNVVMPPTVAAGDLLFIFMSARGNVTFTTPGGGWVIASAKQAVGTTLSTISYKKVAVGNEDGTSVNVVTSANAIAQAISGRVTGWNGVDVTTDVVEGTPATGTSSNPNPPSAAWAWGSLDALALVFIGTTPSASAYTESSGYTTAANESTGSGTSGIRTIVAEKNLTADPSPEDPASGSFFASASWVANTIVISGPASITTTLTPGAATITLTGQNASLHERMFPGIGTITLTAQTPNAYLTTLLQPGAALLTLTGVTPTVISGGTILLEPGAALLTLTAQAASLKETIFPGPGSIVLTAQQAAIFFTALLQPGAAMLTLTGQGSVLHERMFPGAATLTLAGQGSSLITGLTPGPASLTLTGQTANLVFSFILYPGAATLTLSPQAASLLTTIFPGPGALTLTGQGNSLRETLFPGAALLTITTYPTDLRVYQLVHGLARYAPTGVGTARYAPENTGAGRHTDLTLGDGRYIISATGTGRYDPTLTGDGKYDPTAEGLGSDG